MSNLLVDAGPLVAFLHKDDHDHALCVDVLKNLREPLLTTWMPIVEAMYLYCIASNVPPNLNLAI